MLVQPRSPTQDFVRTLRLWTAALLSTADSWLCNGRSDQSAPDGSGTGLHRLHRRHSSANAPKGQGEADRLERHREILHHRCAFEQRCTDGPPTTRGDKTPARRLQLARLAARIPTTAHERTSPAVTGPAILTPASTPAPQIAIVGSGVDFVAVRRRDAWHQPDRLIAINRSRSQVGP